MPLCIFAMCVSDMQVCELYAQQHIWRACEVVGGERQAVLCVTVMDVFDL